MKKAWEQVNRFGRWLAVVLFVDFRGWTEKALAGVLILAYALSTDAKGFNASMSQGARTALYAALAGITGALLGFVLAALAVIVALPDSERMKALRTHPTWDRVPSSYVRASLALLVAVIVSILGIVLDGGAKARQIYELVTVAVVAFALVRVLSSVVALNAVLRVSGTSGSPTPGVVADA
jgi:hypothetical protein